MTPSRKVHGTKPMLNERITVCDGTNTCPPASAGVVNRFTPNAALWYIAAPVAALKAYRPLSFATHTAPPATMGGPNVALPPADQFGDPQLVAQGVNDGVEVLTFR